jgi:hypothetical protein
MIPPSERLGRLQAAIHSIIGEQHRVLNAVETISRASAAAPAEAAATTIVVNDAAPNSVLVADNDACVAKDQGGLEIVDISDSTNPLMRRG